MDFDTATPAGYFNVDAGGVITIVRPGFYRINFFAISYGSGFAYLKLRKNGADIHHGHERAQSDWTDNFADLTWPFAVGDTLEVQIYNPSSYAYHRWNPSGQHSRLQVSYEGPL